MKQLKYYMMILSALLMLGSCSDDDDPTTGMDARISLSSDVLQVTKEGGTVSVTVTSDADWRLAGVCDWAHPSATEGQSGDVVTFTVDENTTDEDLSTTFKFFTGASVAPLVIESLQGNTFDLSSDETVDLTQTGGRMYIQLKGSIQDFSVSFSEGGEGWLTLGEQVEFGGEQVIPLTASANDTYLMRTATVTVSSPSIEKTVQITINQAPTELFEVSAEGMEDNLIAYDLSARTIQLQVVTNLDFTVDVTSGAEWIPEPQVSEPDYNENGLSTYIVSFDLSASTVTRGGTVTFVANRITQVISIYQRDPSAEIVQISSDFADELVEKGWIAPVGGGYVVLEAGMNATVFETDTWINDMTGLDNFPNLEVLRFTMSAQLEEFDISGLHKVNTLDLSSGYYVSVFNFGDNPIYSFTLTDLLPISYARNMRFISERLTYLNCNQSYSWGSTQTVDVTECPALETLVADQCYFLDSIIVREGQDIDISKPDDVAIEYR